VIESLERPHLRRGLDVLTDDGDPSHVYLCDKLRLSPQIQRLSWHEFGWIQLFDGRRNLRDIHAEAIRQTGGELLPFELFTNLVERLDEALFLESPRYRDRLASPIREPSCIGCYPATADALRRQVKQLFTGPGGPGLPGTPTPDGQLRAVLVPHMDYQRGGVSFGWGFKELFERTDARLFLIVGTSHYSSHRFTLTRKHFKTPLGVVETDQAYIDRLVKHYGDGLFDDELAHLPEHSIELEVVILQCLYENQRPFRIVPLVVGTFQDAVFARRSPESLAEVGRMIEALRRTEAETPEPVCTIISGDLAHLGPKFGDRERVEATALARSREQDQRILRHAEAADAAAYFQAIAEEDDRRRICGLPPTYTVLEALRPRRGRVLHYGQYIHPRGHESVSFASVGFYR
jgi:AmmeMemoRadiSam system protein B